MIHHVDSLVGGAMGFFPRTTSVSFPSHCHVFPDQPIFVRSKLWWFCFRQILWFWPSVCSFLVGVAVLGGGGVVCGTSCFLQIRSIRWCSLLRVALQVAVITPSNMIKPPLSSSRCCLVVARFVPDVGGSRWFVR